MSLTPQLVAGNKKEGASETTAVFVDDHKPEPERADEPPGRCLYYVKICLKGTSVKAVPKAVTAEKPFQKAIWALMAMTLVGVAIWQTTILILDYRKLPFTTQTKEIYLMDDLMHARKTVADLGMIPSITLCDLHKKPTNDASFNHIKNSCSSETNYSKLDVSYLKALDEQMKSDSRMRYQQTGFLANDSFVRECQLITTPYGDEVNCGLLVNVTTILTEEYFQCYYVELNGEASKVGFDGSSFPHGISFVLNVSGVSHPPTDLSSQEEETGALVVSTSMKGLPNLRYNGQRVRPGDHTVIQIHAERRNRLAMPFEPCMKVDEFSAYNSEQGVSWQYSYSSCTARCVSDLVAKDCQCLDPATMLIATAHTAQLDVCGARNQSAEIKCHQLSCVKNIHFNLSCCSGQCHEECSYTIYHETVSSSKWKPPTHLMSPGTIHKSNLDEGSSADNLLKVTIQSRSPMVTVSEDMRKYTVSDFLSKLGGTLNLWAGITVMVVVEVIVVFVMACSELPKCCKRRARDYEHVPGDSVQFRGGRASVNA